MSGSDLIVHATTVCFKHRAVLIRGRAGSGKSRLALDLMALGAELVSDDRTVLNAIDDQIIASAPSTIQGQIEARYIGVLNAPYVANAPVHLVIDLDHIEKHRLPIRRHTDYLGIAIPLICNGPNGIQSAAIATLVRYGFCDDD